MQGVKSSCATVSFINLASLVRLIFLSPAKTHGIRGISTKFTIEGCLLIGVHKHGQNFDHALNRALVEDSVVSLLAFEN